MRPGSLPRDGGFTYFGLLLAIASAAGALAGGAYLLANDLRRDKELELLFAGDEIRRAIEAYHARNGAGVDPYPRTLDALLRDPHQPTVVRHLRRVRQDPMREPGAEPPPADTGGWVLVRDVQGRVVGVHSGSAREPLKRSGFPKPYEGFAQARSYADWKFIATGALVAPPAPATAGSFIPSPLSPSGPLVPAARGVPAAPPPAAPPPAAPPPAAPPPAAPPAALAPPADSAPPEPLPAAPPTPPAAPAPSAPAAPAAAPPAPTTPPPAAGASPPPPPPGAPPPAPGASSPSLPPSFQGDGPQPFQMRTF